jgi:hypothetical protein
MPALIHHLVIVQFSLACKYETKCLTSTDFKRTIRSELSVCGGVSLMMATESKVYCVGWHEIDELEKIWKEAI